MSQNTTRGLSSWLTDFNTKWLGGTSQTQLQSEPSAKRSRTQPTKSTNGRSVLNPKFEYVKAVETDLRKSFEIYRREQCLTPKE
jgi:hypothetical protein